MTPTSELQVELQKLRVTVGRIEGWDHSSIRLLQQYPDPVDAYREALRNESALRSPVGLRDSSKSFTLIPDPMLSLEIRRDRTLIGYMVGLGVTIFALWIIAMIMIVVG